MKNPNHLDCSQHNTVKCCCATILFVSLPSWPLHFWRIGSENDNRRMHCHRTAREYRQISSGGLQYAVLYRFEIFLLQICNTMSRRCGKRSQGVGLAGKKKGICRCLFSSVADALFCREVALHERVKLAIEHEHIGIFAVAVAFLGDECVIHRKPGAFKCFFYRFAVGALQ